MKAMLLAAVCAACALTAGAADTAGHRREVRERIANPATREAAIEAALKDGDPAVRRYASFLKTGRDPDRSGARKLHRTNIPLSQDPANDHEVASILSVKARKGVFTLPAKPACDGIELWFAPLKDDDLQFWLNGIYLGQFHRERPGDGQEFRLNAAAEVKWGASNALVVRDGAGKEVVRDFTVEVVKCGK